MREKTQMFFNSFLSPILRVRVASAVEAHSEDYYPNILISVVKNMYGLPKRKWRKILQDAELLMVNVLMPLGKLTDSDKNWSRFSIKFRLSGIFLNIIPQLWFHQGTFLKVTVLSCNFIRLSHLREHINKWNWRHRLGTWMGYK